MVTYDLAHTVSLTLQYELSNGHSGFNVLHLGSTDDLNEANVGTAAGLGAELWENAGAGMTNGLKNSCTTDTRLISCTARSQDPADPLEAVFASGVTGTAGVEAVPSETSVVTGFYTGLASRRGRGRMYMPGLSRNSVTNGQLEPADLAQIADVWNDWSGVVTAGSVFAHAVWSPTDALARSISAYVVRSVLHHQRRRNNR